MSAWSGSTTCTGADVHQYGGEADVEADGSWSWEAADGGEGDWEEELSLQVLPVRQ